MTDIASLKALAEKATPGPWRECGAHRGGCSCGIVWSTTVDFPVAETGVGDEEVGHPTAETVRDNAAYIAAASPDVILRLCEVVEKAKTMMAVYREEFASDPSAEAVAEHSRRCEAAWFMLTAALTALDDGRTGG